MKKLAFPAALLAIVLLVAGCGAAGVGGGDQTDVLSNALISLSGTESVRIDANVKVNAKGVNGGESGSASLSGYVSKNDRASLDGSFTYTKDGKPKEMMFGLRLTKEKLYLKLMSDWYMASLKDLKEMADQQAAQSKKDPRTIIERLRTRAALRDISRNAFVGAVSDGPRLDGVETTQWKGTIDPDGVIEMAIKYGGDDASMTDEERAKAKATLAQISKLLEITVVVGKDDGKPRRIVTRFQANEAEMKEIQKAAGEAGTGDYPDQLDVSVKINLSDYDKPFDVDEPEGAKPIEQLLGAFLGTSG